MNLKNTHFVEYFFIRLKSRPLKKRITATVDKNTYMTSVTVTSQNPRVAAVVADSAAAKVEGAATEAVEAVKEEVKK
jgi:capsular polysaccharide biosynthesis protein